jgi:hypothetical protein
MSAFIRIHRGDSENTEMRVGGIHVEFNGIEVKYGGIQSMRGMVE